MPATMKPTIQASLHTELEDFCTRFAASTSHQDTREDIVTKAWESWANESLRHAYLAHPPGDSQMNVVVKQCFGDSAHVECFGSSSTGLLLPLSDLDFVVYCTPATYDDGFDDTFGEPKRESSLACLRRLEKALAKSCLASPFEKFRIIDATVPVLKFEEKYTRIPIDISTNNMDGKTSSALIREWTAEFPPLMPIALFLKHYLYCAGRNDTYSGGFGSFLLINLLVFLFKQQPALVTGPHAYGTIFLAFLRFYGSLFNYKQWGISARTGKAFELAKDNRLWVRRRRVAFPPALLVEDPTNAEHDLSRGGLHAALMAQKFREDLLRLQEILSQDPLPHAPILRTWLGTAGEDIEAEYCARRRSILNFTRCSRSVHAFP
ncbi:hypothetical protein HDU90_003654 [Geranomyces variabilis]|nr:hypothetical protein HDU90_003654 [Geranomyces variabilis]